MKKTNLLYLSVIFMMLIAGLTFTSCGDDKDDEEVEALNSEEIAAFEDKYWTDEAEKTAMRFSDGKQNYYHIYDGYIIDDDKRQQPSFPYSIDGRKVCVMGSYLYILNVTETELTIEDNEGKPVVMKACNYPIKKASELTNEEYIKLMSK